MAPRKGRKGRKGPTGKPAVKAGRKRRKRAAAKGSDMPPPPRRLDPSTLDPSLWSNDQQIVHDTEARRRRFIAATSSGVAAPPFALINDPRRLHEEMLKRIAAVEETIAKLPTIGHNKPPGPIEAAPLDNNEIEEIKNEIARLKTPPAVPTQPPAEVVEAESKLRTFGEKVLVGVATAVVIGAGKELWARFGDQLIDLANAIAAWIASLPLQ
jgi:hypothetical protein